MNHDHLTAMYRRGSAEPIIFRAGEPIPADLVDRPDMPALPEPAKPLSLDPPSKPDDGAGDGPAQPAPDPGTMDKDQLEAFARARFSVELDKRRPLKALRAQVAALLAPEAQPHA